MVTVADVLRRKRVADADFVLASDAPLSAAVTRIASKARVHSLVVVGPTVTASAERRVVGIVTARDVLRALDRSPDLTAPVSSAMTPAQHIVHISPEDTVTQAALLMSELRIAHLPVIEHGAVLGVVSLADIADIVLEPSRGGKDSAVKRVLPRRGIASPTIIASPKTTAQLQASHRPLFLHSGVTALPRPKRDETPIEDAAFVVDVWWPGYGAGLPDTSPTAAPGARRAGHTLTYIGIADGVGSWHQFDVDPRVYAQRLMSAAQEFVLKRAAAKASPPSPLDVLVAAWETVTAEKVVGSATAMILSLDCLQSALIARARARVRPAPALARPASRMHSPGPPHHPQIS